MRALHNWTPNKGEKEQGIYVPVLPTKWFKGFILLIIKIRERFIHKEAFDKELKLPADSTNCKDGFTYFNISKYVTRTYSLLFVFLVRFMEFAINMTLNYLVNYQLIIYYICTFTSVLNEVNSCTCCKFYQYKSTIHHLSKISFCLVKKKGRKPRIKHLYKT